VQGLLTESSCAQAKLSCTNKNCWAKAIIICDGWFTQGRSVTCFSVSDNTVQNSLFFDRPRLESDIKTTRRPARSSAGRIATGQVAESVKRRKRGSTKKLNTTASILSAAAAFAVLLSGPAFAQAVDPGHPRVNEIQGRIDKQENRVNQGIGQGQINAK